MGSSSTLTADATLKVTKPVLLVHAVPKSRTYREPVAIQLTATYTGFTGGDTAAIVSRFGGNPACTRVAGEAVASSPYAITCTPGSLNDAKYDFATGSTAPFTILRAPVGIYLLGGLHKTYGDSDPTYPYVTAGWRGDDQATAGVTGAPACTRPAGETVGTYALSCSPGTLGLTDPNYTFVAGPAVAFAIQKAILIVDAVPGTKTAGDPDPLLRATFRGYKLGDTAATTPVVGAAACTRAVGETIAGGPYAITCNPSPLSSTNYVFAPGNTASFTITAPVLTVDAAASSKVYGAGDPALTATVTGFRNGDSASILSGTASCSRALGESVSGGPYTTTCTPGTLAADGYTFAPGASAPFFITPATLSVDATAATKIYGTVDPTLTATYSGFVGHDTAATTTVTGAPVCTRATGETVAVGPYAITCTEGTLHADNYRFAKGSTADLTVTKAPLAVTPTDASRLYSAPNPTLTGTIAGIVNGDPITATYGTDAGLTSVPAGYPITATLHDVNGELANYSVTRHPGTLTVTIARSTTTLTAVPNPSALGTPVTLTATVAPVAPATATPVGTVTFYDGTTPLGTGTLDAHGTATLVTTAPHAGARTLTARYTGDSLIATSRSAEVTQTIQKAPTRIVATRAQLRIGTILIGRYRLPILVVRLSAVLDRPDTGAKLAGQQVVFAYGTAVQCTATTDATGIASCDAPLSTFPTLERLRGYTVTFAATPDYAPGTTTGAPVL